MTTNAGVGNPNAKAIPFKLVLLGESAVGKSSLVLRFVRGQFFEYQESTIGGMNNCLEIYKVAAFLTQTVPLGDSIVKFEIWDTGELLKRKKNLFL